MSIAQLKELICDVGDTDMASADKPELMVSIAESDNGGELMDSYYIAKRIGEVYEYDNGRCDTVEFTDEATA